MTNVGISVNILKINKVNFESALPKFEHLFEYIKNVQEVNMLQNIQELLENAFKIFNKEYYENELPEVVITIQSSPKAYGHFTIDPVWMENNKECLHEINISAEYLNRPIENILATLQHEMVHLFCVNKGIADTSKGGRYHNKYFKKEAEKRGLILNYEKYIGYSITLPNDAFKNLICSYGLEKPLDLRRGVKIIGKSDNGNGSSGDGTDDNRSIDVIDKKKISSTRNWICTSCGNKCRSTKDINILCGDCLMAFEKVMKK